MPESTCMSGPGFAAAAHRHHCVQLLMMVRGALRIRSAPKRRWRRGRAVWVRPDAVHEMEPVINGIELALSMPDLLLGRDSSFSVRARRSSRSRTKVRS
jgi:hypothetical protein